MSKPHHLQISRRLSVTWHELQRVPGNEHKSDRTLMNEIVKIKLELEIKKRKRLTVEDLAAFLEWDVVDVARYTHPKLEFPPQAST